MEAINSDIQKKYEDLAILQKERLLLRTKNLDVKANYPGIIFFFFLGNIFLIFKFFFICSLFLKKLSLRDCRCGRAS